jgi:hypothetical protein
MMFAINEERCKEKRWGCSDIPGRIYRVTKTNPSNRTFEGDLLLCVMLTGDNHYAYIRLIKDTNNGHSLYFRYGEFLNGYGGKGWGHVDAYPKMTTRTAEQILEAMIPGTSFLVSCKEAEEFVCTYCRMTVSNKTVCQNCIDVFEKMKEGKI